MAPRFWHPKSDSHLKKCSEFVIGGCNAEATGGGEAPEIQSATFIPDSGPAYANLSDLSDLTYNQMNGFHSSDTWTLSNTPSDLVEVIGVTIRIRMAQKSDGSDDDFESVQILKTDGSTAITSICNYSGLTGTKTDYEFVPETIHFTDKASWDGAKIKIFKNNEDDGGSTQGIRIYELAVDITYTDGTTVILGACCAVIPCSYCLTWSPYGDDDQFGVADFDTDGWYGTVANSDFRGYWERNQETHECEFVVSIDGFEIYRKSCYEGQSCRDSSDSAEATIGYDDGVLRWDKILHRPLEYVIDETYCRVPFCGTCECSCECLCVTVLLEGSNVATGEICDTAYPCDGPVWEGDVGIYHVTVVLDRDEYGNCTATATVDEETSEPTLVSGCEDMTVTIVMPSGLTLSVVCKVCSCDAGCGDGCCVPYRIESLYPNGVLDQIPFCLTSDCPTLDGECGEFTPLVPTSTPRGTCGFCASYLGDWAGLVPGEFPTGLPEILNPSECMMSPCLVEVCLVLECNQDEDAVVGQNACCSKMRLWVGITSLQIGDIGEMPQNTIVPCTSWRKIAPTMCECDEESGIIATFPVAISFVCPPWVGGVCDGIPNCCNVACAFDVVI